MSRTVIGLTRLVDGPPAMVKGARLGLLSHLAAVDAEFRPAGEVIAAAFPGQLAALFGPQHGFIGDKQANMIESGHDAGPETGVPVFSLYGETRRPTDDMLEPIDVMIVDLTDVGARVYTYIHTLSLTLEACGQRGVPVIVLDRPNPIGGLHTEGNVLDPDLKSFVGLHPIPQRHGLTIGEMARMIVGRFGIEAELHVIEMTGWRRGQWFDDTGLAWTMPSPNMPSLDTALVYPGQVLWEGTNVSEGRGTTRPFEIMGAPFIVPAELIERFSARELPGVRLRPVTFEPAFDKFAGRLCHGVQLHVTDREAFRPVITSLALLQDVSALYPDHFGLLDPPYEYDFTHRPVDIIVGSASVVDRVLGGDDISAIRADWLPGLDRFNRDRSRYLLYDD